MGQAVENILGGLFACEIVLSMGLWAHSSDKDR